jgi:radical SAM/Cys-rich protein
MSNEQKRPGVSFWCAITLISVLAYPVSFGPACWIAARVNPKSRLLSAVYLPIGRFASFLRNNNKLDSYMELLLNAFNPGTIEGLMCRNTVSVGWQGEVYDCDFNQQLGMQWGNGHPLFLWDLDPASVEDREIMTGDHCFGCTAGAGSSCGGALV